MFSFEKRIKQNGINGNINYKVNYKIFDNENWIKFNIMAIHIQDTLFIYKSIFYI